MGTNFPTFDSDVFEEKSENENSKNNKEKDKDIITTESELISSSIELEDNNFGEAKNINPIEKDIPDFLDFEEDSNTSSIISPDYSWDTNTGVVLNKDNFKNTTKSNLSTSMNNKKLLLLWVIGVVFLLLWIAMYFILNSLLNSNSKVDKSIYNNTNISSNNAINQWESTNNNIQTNTWIVQEESANLWEILFTSNSSNENLNLSTTNSWESIDIKENINYWTWKNNITQVEDNFEINVEKVWNDEFINTNLALLWNYENKVKVNNLWEFDWYEKNNNINWWITTKQESKTIESIPKVNYIPNININIDNKETSFLVSDVITLKFDVILNSRSQKYSITKKLYWWDYVINITPLEISSPLISLEENLVTEEIILPLELMTKWNHKVGIKVNNLTKATYEFIVK